ncbi:MAG: hypothetical protein AB1744_04890, partial [Candidatus Zixiibacteriota bacterium]
LGRGARAPWAGYALAPRRSAVQGGVSRPRLTARVNSYWLFASIFIVAFIAAFIVLRARAHFLGDGYTVLSLLADDNPLIKTREIGEALLHIWVKNLIGSGSSAALASFQIISIGAGVLLMVALVTMARRLFDRIRDRVLFVVGLSVSGCMLLFFGYVENYSLFVLTVLVYTLLGLLIAKEQLNRWWIVLPQVLAIFFHLLGAILIPATVYLLAANTRFGRRLAHADGKTKLLLTLAVIAVGVFAFYRIYSSNPFFRFAFVPILPGRFTIEGYTLFSLKHLADFVNLLLLLLPGLPVFVVILFRQRLRPALRQRGFRFMAVLVASVLGAVFVLDPKLGMPRDWDLFAFAGVPLAVLAFYLILGHCREFIGTFSAVLMIALGLLSLGPRVAAQVAPGVAEARFWDYMFLDRIKNKNARIILESYYKGLGREEEMKTQLEEWKQSFPEQAMLTEAIKDMQSGAFFQAKEKVEEVIAANPMYWNAWSVLGTCHYNLHDLDSALICLRVADGLNPYSTRIYNNLANVYFGKRDYGRARTYWEKALGRDSLMLGALAGLDRLELTLRSAEEPCRHLTRAGARPDASVDILKALGDCYVSYREYERARKVFDVALHRGLDSAYVEQLAERFPQLRR